MRTGLAVLALSLYSGSLSAQNAPSPDRPDGRRRDGETVALAVRGESGGVRVDGRLDEAVWASAPVSSNFVQRNPDEGRPATERTEFRVVYTDDAIYVGVRAYDSDPQSISALLTRRDEHSPSDLISVMIDSYHDRRTAFQFSVNPAGVKQDAFIYNDTEVDMRWDAVWDVATSIDAEGWTAEFHIPFSQLRFASGDRYTFGFNVSRHVSRLNEEQYWRPWPKTARGRVSLFGELTGIQNITPPRRLEVLPYTLVSASRATRVANNPFRTGSSENAAVGADIRYGINSALTLSATVNPDFGQVEADPAVVNLSAFETFFPERRPFFNEGIDIFRFRIADGDGDDSNQELFYTRRIGRTPQGRADARGGYAARSEPVTILAAAKVSGKTQDGWTIGLLGALTDEEGVDVIDGAGAPFTDVVEPRTVHLVGRLGRDLRDGQSQVSLFATTVRRDAVATLGFLHEGAYALGLNWSHRFADDSYQFSGRLVGSRVEGTTEAITATQLSSARYYQRPDASYLTFDPTRTSLQGFTAAMNVGRTAGNWRWSTGFDTRSPGFEVNDLGFMPRADFFQQFVWINRRWLEPGKVFRRFNLNFNQWSGWSYGGERRGIGGNVNANFTFSNYWNGYLGLNRQFGGVNTSELRGGPAVSQPGGVNGWGGLSSDGRKAFRGGANGWFYLQDETDNWGLGVSTNLSWRPASNVDLTASPNVNWSRDEWQFLASNNVLGEDQWVFGDIRQTTVAMTFRGNLTLSPTFTLQAYVQPFVSTARYEAFRRVVAPRANTFWGQFEDFTADQIVRPGDGPVELDFDRDGATDLQFNEPDFTYLSFRSNVVLRWEYLLGSTVFLVWQHGRTGYMSGEGQFDLGNNLDELFRSDFENVFLVKLNYWISP